MLIHPILDKLRTLRFFGMLTALEEQMQMPDIERLSFEERFGLLVERVAHKFKTSSTSYFDGEAHYIHMNQLLVSSALIEKIIAQGCWPENVCGGLIRHAAG